jgi:hypothetical protein
MTFTFRPAVRESVGLIIGLAGGTGSGKTYSAMRLASGIAQGRRFCVIDTEGGRAKHYAADFAFDHGDLKAPFRPSAYMEAIEAADDAGYPVIVVDSVSHEWSGEGGVLEWQEEEYKRLGAKEAIKLLSWSAPKQAHKRMVSRLLQCRAHLILCFRAEPHVEMTKEKGSDGRERTVVKPKTGFTGYNGWFPVTEKNLPFELTVYFMMMAEHPGIPHPIKLQQQHKALFPLDKEITEASGAGVAEWAAGGSTNGATAPANAPTTAQTHDGGESSADPTHYVTPDQLTYLGDQFRERAVSVEAFCKKAGVQSLAFVPATDYQRTLDYIARVVDERAKRATA